MSEQHEGWWQPRTSRKIHYFRKSRSLCGRYGAHGVTELQELDPCPDSCPSCMKKLTAEQSA